MNTTVYILGIMLQFVAAIIALLQLRRTPRKLPWLMISLSSLLIVARRSATISQFVQTGRELAAAEVLTLIISLLFFLGVIFMSRMFQDMEESGEKIKNLLKEKEIILREVHHRIKNNMNTIHGLIFLQANSLDDINCRNILNDAAGRVKQMMLLYDKLYRSENTHEMNIKNFLPHLVKEIIEIFPNGVSVKTDIRIDDFNVSMKILSPIGIIINELITNSMKYAFKEIDNGIISISASKNDNKITLIYDDNGIGFQDNKDAGNHKGFGIQLINMLVEQINGSIKFDGSRGTRFIIEFSI